MMIKICIVLLMVFPALSCERDYYIVSDFDDTIKSYKSDGTISFIFQAIFKKRMNAGFDVLYSEMVKESSDGCKNGFTILTASPNPMKGIVKSFFENYSFPEFKLITKKTGADTLEYKVGVLEREALRVDAPFLLIGDDSSKDPDAYSIFDNENLGKVSQIYIHRLENREALPGQIRYLTAFDIALNEYVEGRLSRDAMIRVGNAVLSSEDYQIIPKYGYCPHDQNLFSNEAVEQKVVHRISTICKNR